MGSVLRRDQSDSERAWGRPLSVSFLHRTSGKECEYHSQAGSTTLSGQLICAIEDTALQVKYFIGSIDPQRYDQLSCAFYNMNVALCCLFR